MYRDANMDASDAYGFDLPNSWDDTTTFELASNILAFLLDSSAQELREYVALIQLERARDTYETIKSEGSKH
jgi:hypothetical protein